MRKFGSTANVCAVPVAITLNPSASVSGVAAVFATLMLRENGTCCAIADAML